MQCLYQVFSHTVLWKAKVEVDQSQKTNRASNVSSEEVDIQLQKSHGRPLSNVRAVYREPSSTLPYEQSYFYIVKEATAKD